MINIIYLPYNLDSISWVLKYEPESGYGGWLGQGKASHFVCHDRTKTTLKPHSNVFIGFTFTRKKIDRIDQIEWFTCYATIDVVYASIVRLLLKIPQMNIWNCLLVQIYIFNRSVLTALTHRADSQRSRSTLLNMVYLPLITWQSCNNKLQSTFSDCLPMINDD